MEKILGVGLHLQCKCGKIEPPTLSDVFVASGNLTWFMEIPSCSFVHLQIADVQTCHLSLQQKTSDIEMVMWMCSPQLGQ